MAITKTEEIAKIEVVGEYKHIQVRTDTVIKEDGKEISRSAHRVAYAPGAIDEISNNYVATDLSSEHADVQAIANTAWTDSVKAAWKSKLEG